MNNRFVDFLDESALACFLLLGLSIAGGVVFGLGCIVTGIWALAGSAWYALAFVLSGLLSGLSFAFAVYIYNEHC